MGCESPPGCNRDSATAGKFCIPRYTPPKLNIEPENDSFQKGSSQHMCLGYKSKSDRVTIYCTIFGGGSSIDLVAGVLVMIEFLGQFSRNDVLKPARN